MSSISFIPRARAMRAAALRVVAAIAFLGAIAARAEAPPPVVQTWTAGGGGASRSYFLSDDDKPKQPRPLIVALHGGGSNAALLAAATGLSKAARDAGFLVAYPNGSGAAADAYTWNSGACCGYAKARNVDDVAHLQALVARLVSQGRADPARVFAVGFSNGGMMAYRWAAQAPGTLRAVAAVSATLDIDPALVREGLPVLHIHGTDDPYVPYAGGIGRKASTGAPRLAVEAAVARWAAAMDARAQGAEKLRSPAGDDGTSVTRVRHATASDPQAVVLYRIEGGGHTWPGSALASTPDNRVSRQLDASETVVAFFKAHAKPCPKQRAASRSLRC
ncbi:PHB depolymerase family esterase [Variovorax sp. KBW07]|uniref:alpha/beta hydrolase family esterase n=1 Tax=Variovorax sp. KBW07 TaxID=2153358 RepID=UPI001628C626|nr:PHB depolymerase family esterase [Variovorax sp. KBW07]